jgi:hypothetical protein
MFMMSLLPKKRPTISSIELLNVLKRRRLSPIVVIGLVVAVLSCELRTPPALITVYNPSMKISVPIPQGWRSELGDQSGFRMHTFTGPSVDVPERPGIRAQVMLGPMPKDKALDELSERYTEGHTVTQEQGYSLHGFAGKTWLFQSADGAESSRLMLTEMEGRLYGIYIHGESPTMDANRRAIDAMLDGLSIEEARFFETYERTDIGLFLKHPRSWARTAFLSKSGESLFVAFRSPPLLLEEGGTTIHATLEVTVNKVEPGTTLESYYSGRADIQGDNYRLLSHDVINEGDAISDLYHIETQLAQHLERTLYFIRGDKSYIFKFNCQNTVYRQIEPWIEEIITTFAPRDVT